MMNTDFYNTKAGPTKTELMILLAAAISLFATDSALCQLKQELKTVPLAKDELNLKEIMDQDVISAMMEEFGEIAPSVTTVLIHERDIYIAKKILDESKKGKVIAVASEGDREIGNLVDHVITIPNTFDFLEPMLLAVPLQLLAYHIAVIRGANVDKPRNLAKSVTVE